MNFGCGPDIKDGWTNVDSHPWEGAEIWDGTGAVWIDDKRVHPVYDNYDFILVNHVLCTMKPWDVKLTLKNLYDTLKVGGQIEIIDVDMMKAFSAYHNNKPELFPITEGSLDYKLCIHLSGYGTRLSLFTKEHLKELLREAGFINPMYYKSSKYDLRPNESLVVRATKGIE